MQPFLQILCRSLIVIAVAFPQLLCLSARVPAFASNGRLGVFFKGGREVPLFDEEDQGELALRLRTDEMEPLCLASGDFDGDGIADLITVFARADGAVLIFQKGNVDSIFPDTEKARRRRREGSFLDQPFYPVSKLIKMQEIPDFVVTGDLNSDGKLDLVLARRGFSHFSYLLGRGDGTFEPVQKRELSGEITAFTAGEVNLADGRVDLIIGVTSQDGPRLLVLQSRYGALKAEPTSVELAEPASAIATGHFNEDVFVDVAFSMGDQLMLLPGQVEAVASDVRIESRAIWIARGSSTWQQETSVGTNAKRSLFWRLAACSPWSSPRWKRRFMLEP